MYGEPTLIGEDLTISPGQYFAAGAGLAIVLNVALFGLLTYGVYRLVKG